MNALKRDIIRLLRMPQTRGFGVQSPSDYKFITRALRAAIPSEVSRLLPDDKDCGTFLKLIYLVANHCQPLSLLNMTGKKEVESIVLLAKSDCHVCPLTGNEGADLLVADALTMQMEWLQQPFKCLIVGNINSDSRCQALWQQVIHDQQSVLVFDLYSSGVVMNIPHRFPEHYKAYF